MYVLLWLIHIVVWQKPNNILKIKKNKTRQNMKYSGGSDIKESAYNAGDLGSIPGLGRAPRGGHGNPLQYSCLENPQEQKSLAGYSPWGSQKLDMTERPNTAQQTWPRTQAPGERTLCILLPTAGRRVWCEVGAL